jgi:Domain of unknown function (DUF4252)
MRTVMLLSISVLSLAAQEFKMPPGLSKLADKASEVVDVTLDGNMLRLAGKFLSKDDPDEVKVKNLITGLKGIYVKAYEFDKEGEYSPADVEALRSQVRGPGWSRMVGVLSKKDGQNAEIFMKLDGDRIGGLLILAAEPKELTIVSIVGSIDVDQLSELGGHFGIPDVEVRREGKKTEKTKD